jgi:hypothetical protein
VAATLVDSNVLLDVITEDEEWLDWSAAALSRAAGESSLVINPIVYAEVAARFARIEDLEDALPLAYYERRPLPWEAAFLAGQCLHLVSEPVLKVGLRRATQVLKPSPVKYRRRGGVRRSPLPDFYIAAHAAIEGLTLLTRDPRRYRTYFPKLRIIAP